MAKTARRSVAQNPSSLTSSSSYSSGSSSNFASSSNVNQYHSKGSSISSNSNTSGSVSGSSGGVVDPLRNANDQFTTRTLPTYGRHGVSEFSTTARPYNSSSSNSNHSYEQHINSSTTYTKEFEPTSAADKAAADRERIRMEFYAQYDVMTGVRIAVTLGGFFGLMVFLIIWKSRGTSNETLKVLKDPKIAAVAVACMQEEEEREIQEAIEATGLSLYPDEYDNIMYRRQRLLSLGNVSAPPVLHRNYRFSSVGGGYSSLLEPSRRYSYSGGRRRSVASESSRVFSAYPMGSSFGTDDYFVETDDELENEFENISTRGGPSRKNTLEVPPSGQESRRSSGMTCCSTESSYLERRCSAITLGLSGKPPPTSSSRRSSTDTWDYYYPDIHIIQPTPKTSPCPSERSLYEKSSKKLPHHSASEAFSHSYISSDDKKYQRKGSYYDSDSISDYRIDKPSFSISGNRHVFKVKVDHHSYPSQFDEQHPSQQDSPSTPKEDLFQLNQQPSTSINYNDNNESTFSKRKSYDPTYSNSIIHNGSSSYNFTIPNRSTEGIKRAPLASISSFKISSIDYQDSDLRSLGSDSVFVESYADTDDDMEQFSTDSDEISISLGADLSSTQQPTTQQKTQQQQQPVTQLKKPTTIQADHNGVTKSDQQPTITYDTKTPSSIARSRPVLERHRSISVPSPNDKIIQQLQDKPTLISPTADTSFRSEPIRPPPNHSTILLSPPSEQQQHILRNNTTTTTTTTTATSTTITISSHDDNHKNHKNKDEIVLSSAKFQFDEQIQKKKFSFSYDNNKEGVSISNSNPSSSQSSCNNNNNYQKQKQMQIQKDNDKIIIETKVIINDDDNTTTNNKYQSKLYSNSCSSNSNSNNSERVEVKNAVIENRPTIISPSVILELPVISLPSQDDDPPRDPSLPGTSRKWSKETLF